MNKRTTQTIEQLSAHSTLRGLWISSSSFAVGSAWPRWSTATLKADGGFLMLVGGAQMIFELLSHFRSTGPLGTIFAGSHYTIGFLEAHGLALLIGVTLLRAARAPQAFWHLFAVIVHMLLGGANLLFWQSFVAWGLVPAGAGATIVHGLLILANLIALARAPRVAQ